MDVRTIRFSCSTMVFAAILLAACGGSESGLVDKGFRGVPLGTLRGTLRASDTSALGPEISMALLWEPPDFQLTAEELIASFPPTPQVPCTGEPDPERRIQEGAPLRRPGRVTQQFSFEASFPLRFEMPIFELPPADVRVELDDGSQYALGSVVVFIDSNRNGLLDVPAADLAGDEIIALPSDVTVIYADGDLFFDQADGSTVPLPQGLSLSVRDQVRPLQDGVDIDVVATLAERKAAEHSACSSVVFRDEYGADPSNFDPEESSCSEDGLIHVQSSLNRPALDRICVLTQRIVIACLEPDAPVPADWPCD